MGVTLCLLNTCCYRLLIDYPTNYPAFNLFHFCFSFRKDVGFELRYCQIHTGILLLDTLFPRFIFRNKTGYVVSAICNHVCMITMGTAPQLFR